MQKNSFYAEKFLYVEIFFMQKNFFMLEIFFLGMDLFQNNARS